MYNAKIVMEKGQTILLGFEYGVVFDITPLSGVDVEILTSQSFQQVGESVQGSSITGITRELHCVPFKNEKEISNQILRTFTPNAKGKVFVNGFFFDFVVQKTPFVFTSKYGKTTIDFLLYCPYPFWRKETKKEYIFGGVKPLFSFPTTYDSHKFGEKIANQAMNCKNEGTIESSLFIEFKNNTPTQVSNFGVINTDTGDFIGFNTTLIENDKLTVFVEDGILVAEKSDYGGRRNAVFYLMDGSNLFSVGVGDNPILPFADTGLENLSVYINFNEGYSGVIV